MVWFILYRNHDNEKLWGYFEKVFLKDNMHLFHTVIDMEPSKDKDILHRRSMELNVGFPVTE